MRIKHLPARIIHSALKYFSLIWKTVKKKLKPNKKYHNRPRPYKRQNPKKVERLIVTIVLAIVLLVGFSLWKTEPITWPHMQFDSKNNNTTPNKIILFWTPFYSYEDYDFGIGQDPFIKHECKVQNCITTKDRSILNQSDAVIFHLRNIDQSDLPPIRYSWQRYVFYLVESPVYTHQNVRIWNHFFNWTMTYRQDSDVTTTYRVEEKTDNQPANYKFRNNSAAVWFVSHCQTNSAREELVWELQKYMKIDIFGNCGTLICDKTYHSQCLRMAERKYKFYLALENSLCKDYVTEKFLESLNYNMVPVVYSGTNYSKLFPGIPHVNVLDFKNAKELAQYLLDFDDRKYLDWKSKYRVKIINDFCNLCEKLNENTISTKIYQDLSEWWEGKGICFSRHWTSSFNSIKILIKSAFLDSINNPIW